MNNEIWKDIEGYEGLYQVSNYGQVRSLHHEKPIILKQHTNIKGYKKVGLSKDGKSKTVSVHRLVAKAFLPNPTDLPMVNHKDENPSNNIVDNLEWCDGSYNVTYATAPIRRKMTRNENRNPLKSWIGKFDLMTGEIVDVFPSIEDAAKEQAKSEDDIPELFHNIISIINNDIYPERYDYRFLEL